jgi:uncharacterized protein YpuA (DUF1002 family)
MKIPKQIKVGAQQIRVYQRDFIFDDKGDSVCGLSNLTKNRIDLALKKDKGQIMSETCVADTFLHEVLHLVSGNYGIGLTENQIAGLSGSLLAVIRDNDLDFKK